MACGYFTLFVNTDSASDAGGGQDFDWVRFAQTEIRHLQVVELLEASLAEAEQMVSEVKSRSIGGTLLPFTSAAKRAAEQRIQATAALAAIHRRIHEERRALEANEHALHEALHEWLMVHDAEYAVSAEVDLLCESIEASLSPMREALVELLARYGSTRNEIAVSFDHETGSLSLAALASVERLVATYDDLLTLQNRFGSRLERLKGLVEETFLSDVQLRLFDQALPPDCRAEMDYATLRANFEAGADQIRAALDQLRQYAGEVSGRHVIMEKKLYEYRETRWQAHLSAVREAL